MDVYFEQSLVECQAGVRRVASSILAGVTVFFALERDTLYAA